MKQGKTAHSSAEHKATGHLWVWALALLGAVGGHALWFGTLSTTWAVPRDQMPETMPWRWSPYVPGQEAPGEAEFLTVAAPTLFAFPTKVGFSRPLVTERIAVRPPVDRPPEMALYLHRTNAVHNGTHAVTLPSWPALRGQRTELPLQWPEPEQTVERMGAQTHATPRMYSLVSEAGRELERIDWSGETEQWGGAPWAADVVVHINPMGVVTHVLLDESTAAPEANERLLRVLYAGRWAPAATTDALRYHVVYAGGRSAKQGEDS